MSLVPGRVAVLSALLAAALFRCSPVPQPEASPAAQSGLSTVVTQAAPPEPSVISIPLHISLASVAKLVEPKVPVTFHGKSQERGFTVTYDVARRPLALEIIGRGVHTRAKVLYGIEACTRALPCISCGKKQAPREADVALQSVLSWTADWKLRSTTRALPTSFPVRCTVTPLRLDITDRFIAPVVASQLATAAAEIDRNVPSAANLRPDAERIWAALRKPIEIAPRTWLLFEPSRVALSPLTGKGTDAMTTLTMEAMTRVTAGDRPVVPGRALPRLEAAAPAAASLRVPLHVDLPWSELARVLTAQVTRTPMKTADGELTVESLTVTSAPGAKMRVDAKVDYRAGLLSSYRGTVSFTGTPKLDASGSTVTFPDLEYLLGSDAGFFARNADRLAHETLEARLRQSLRIDLRPQLTRLRSDVAHGLTRNLAPGASMRGRIDDMRVTSMTTNTTGLAMRLLAIGAAEITVQ